MYSYNVWKFNTQNFTVSLDFEEEFCPPDWFTSEEEEKALIHKIYNGELLYFCARVSVIWRGQEIGSDSLGCCCYQTPKDFMEGGYFRDMVREAIIQARKHFKELSIPKLRVA
jgi:hypothetical protein